MPEGRRGVADLLPFDPDPERSLHWRKRAKKSTLDSQDSMEGAEENQAALHGDQQLMQRGQHDNDRAIHDFATPGLEGLHSSIRRPAIEANNFELKPIMFQMLQTAGQYGGLPSEDPHAHLRTFMEICDTYKQNGVSRDAIRLMLFPFSLRDKARMWLNSLPANSITTWNELAQKFLEKYFPPAKTAKLRNDIVSFYQFDGESLYETWERFKDMLRMCPHHGIPPWIQIQTFYNGLLNSTRTVLDAAAGGALLSKSYNETYALLEKMASNTYQWPTERRKVAGIHEVDAVSALSAKLDALTKQMQFMASTSASVNAINLSSVSCNWCGEIGHMMEQCGANPESVNYVSNVNRSQNNPYSNTYNQGWRNHPNFAWGNQGAQQQTNPTMPPRFPVQQQTNQTMQPPEKKPSLEDMFMQFMQSQAASMRNLENQMGQLAAAMGNRQPGNLPSDTEINPRNSGKEQCHAITLRSGKKLSPVTQPQVDETKATPIRETEEREVEQKVAQKEDSNMKEAKVVPVRPPPPFPQRFQKQKSDQQFKKFLDVLKQLHINIPFVEALEQMPSYVKFMKDILSKKRRLVDNEIVALSEECSAIMQNKLPPKLKDPGSFTISCNIGNHYFGKALCDLGASINLMPMSIFNKLGIGEARPTNITLQLADRTITYPEGVIDDVLVKVDKLIFPVDFVVMDYEEDKNIPIILGRPFLATAGAVIDVKHGKLTLNVEEEKVEFDVFQIQKQRAAEDECLRIEAIYGLLKDETSKKHSKNSIAVGSVHEAEEKLDSNACKAQQGAVLKMESQGK